MTASVTHAGGETTVHLALNHVASHALSHVLSHAQNHVIHVLHDAKATDQYALHPDHDATNHAQLSATHALKHAHNHAQLHAKHVAPQNASHVANKVWICPQVKMFQAPEENFRA